MIRSMTGYGRYELSDENGKMIVELKSVNHRYLDLNIKTPKKLGPFENDIRNYLKQRLQRGKVDVYIAYEESADAMYQIRYNSQIAAEYLKNLRQMAQEFQLEDNITATNLSRYPDVFELVENPLDEEYLKDMLMKTLQLACDAFIVSRESEGQRLKEDLLAKMEEMEGYVLVIEQRSPEIIAEYKKRILAKIEELLGDHQIDESRIAMEVTMYADKVCVDEEIVRLRSHVQETIGELKQGESIGRKLDFIAQEMNRESNTILSKSADVEIANIGIALKTLVEKVREQIQNIE